MIIKRRKWRVFKDGSMNNFVERSNKTESQITIGKNTLLTLTRATVEPQGWKSKQSALETE